MKPSAFSTSLACASAAPNNATRTPGSAPAPAAAAAAICCVPPVIEWYTIKRVAIRELSQKDPVGYVLQAAATPSDCIVESLPGDSQHPAGHAARSRRCEMLHYAVVFFIIALIAAVFGFGGIAVGAAGIAKILFVVFLIGAVISFLMSIGRRV